MATANGNRAWDLESFLDSLAVELDRARDTLAVKAMTRPLTYSVQDVGLQLQVFPQYDGDKVRFVTAQPGEAGSSQLKLDLGSITARSIKETTRDPIATDDVSIDDLPGIDPDTKKSLERVGINSADDLERVKERNVDLQKVTGKKLDYSNLAGIINQARRRKVPPSVTHVGLSQSQSGPLLAIAGDNLDVAGTTGPEFPVARLDGEQIDVVSSSPTALELRVDPRRLAGRTSRLEIALDPFAVVSLELEHEEAR